MLFTSFDVFTVHWNAGEKCSCLPFWSSFILVKKFHMSNFDFKTSFDVSQFTAMLVKSMGKVVFLCGCGQFSTQDSYSVALLVLTVSYLCVKKLLPLTLQLINTLEISIEKAFQTRKKEDNSIWRNRSTLL